MPRCIFCYAKKVSKEHIWGRWWQKYYAHTEAEKLRRGVHQITFRSESGELATKKGLFSNVGTPISKTSKIACVSCNTGWMSVIETHMERAFKRLYVEDNETIGLEDSTAFRKWLYLKFCLRDRAYEERFEMFPLGIENREELISFFAAKREKRWSNFFREQEVPPDFHFFIARAGSVQTIGGSNLLTNDEVLPTPDGGILIDTCLFMVGHFLAVITNHQKLVSMILDPHKSGILGEAVVDLASGECQLPLNPRIDANVFEDKILCLLESITGDSLRRNTEY